MYNTCLPGALESLFQKWTFGTFPVVQWLRPWASNAEDTGSIPGWGTKIPHAMGGVWPKKKKKRKESIYNYILCRRVWSLGKGEQNQNQEIWNYPLDELNFQTKIQHIRPCDALPDNSTLNYVFSSAVFLNTSAYKITLFLSTFVPKCHWTIPGLADSQKVITEPTNNQTMNGSGYLIFGLSLKIWDEYFP